MSGAAITSRSQRVSLPRLALVEGRKMADTRASFWLLLLTALSAAAAVIAEIATSESGSSSLGDTFATAMLAASVLLPIVPILLMTGEWSQRTALGTFALVPVRERVIAAKLIATFALLLALCALCLVLAIVGTAADGGNFEIAADEAWRIVLYDLLGLLFGFALAAILMNSPAAIVLNFIAPILVAGIGAISRTIDDLVVWIDPGAWGALTDTVTSSSEWSKIGTSALAWIVVPIVLGIVRLRRRDIS